MIPASDERWPGPEVSDLCEGVLEFFRSCEVANRPGVHRYSPESQRPTLYASSYAARTRSLLGELAGLCSGERQAWLDYFNSHQDEDGLYRDPVIFGEGWYRDDPLWCGRTHLTGHVLGAVTALGGVSPREMTFLDSYRDPDKLEQWLDSRDWGERVAFTGNEICNIGRLLQYARDFHDDAAAGRAVDLILDWLMDHRFNPELGLWGEGAADDPLWLSHAIQGAYHWWILYFYDRRPVPAPERTIDSLLRSQNEKGGFGWGGHNPDNPSCSSACEDIDSVHPLAQLSVDHEYRREEVRTALRRAADWIVTNRLPDGGFAFVKGQPYAYGHEQLSNPEGVSGTFPTWFRMLSLAQIGKALPDHPLGQYPWHFDRCPGPQLWNQVD
jgi:hypothetical protein